MGLKATNNLLGIEDMRQKLISYCKATSCGGCLFKWLYCNFNRIDEEEIGIYYALIFETDEMKREDKKNLIYEMQWLKQHCNNVCETCALVDIEDCSCFDKEEIIHRNLDIVMKKRKELLEHCKNVAVLVVVRIIYATAVLSSIGQISLITILEKFTKKHWKTCRIMEKMRKQTPK